MGYTEDILDQEAIILKYYFPIYWSDVYPWLDDDDSETEIVPMEFFYQEDAQSQKLQHAQTELPSKIPVIRYNGDSFMDALGGVLAFLQDRKLTATPWFERLQMVKRMFDDEANELHLLHNAGLFDHATLWSWLHADLHYHTIHRCDQHCACHHQPPLCVQRTPSSTLFGMDHYLSICPRRQLLGSGQGLWHYVGGVRLICQAERNNTNLLSYLEV